jgi:hypothetical protein
MVGGKIAVYAPSALIEYVYTHKSHVFNVKNVLSRSAWSNVNHAQTLTKKMFCGLNTKIVDMKEGPIMSGYSDIGTKMS